MAKLIPKSRLQLVNALEHDLYLLSRTLGDLSLGDAAFLRLLAGQLRSLICTTSGLTGLLWRVCDEFDVSDTVQIRYAGKVDKSNPLARGMYYCSAIFSTGGNGPDAVPLANHSLKEHIREHEAAYIDGVSLSHEDLITELGSRMGVGHEAPGVSRELAKLNSVLIGNVQPYFHILEADALLTLEVGERAIQSAIAQKYVRQRPPSNLTSSQSLTSTRFVSTLDVPSTPMSSNEGTILFVLQLSGIPVERRFEQPVRFPPFTQGPVTVWAEVSRRRRVSVFSSGLPLPNFGFDFPLPDPLPESLAIVIAWDGMRVKGYAAGKQVAGTHDSHESPQ
jgi:hypothetical protein